MENHPFGVLTECEANPDLYAALFVPDPPIAVLEPEPEPLEPQREIITISASPVLVPITAEIPAGTTFLPVEGFSSLQRFGNFATMARQSVEHRVDLADFETEALDELLDMLRGRVSFHDVRALGVILDGSDVGAVRDHMAAMRAREGDLSDDERAAFLDLSRYIESIAHAAGY